MEDILNEVLGEVPQETKVNKKRVPQEMKVINEGVGSVADHLIEYIKEHCITSKELDKLKIDIENLVNKRLNYGLKQIKEELKEGK